MISRYIILTICLLTACQHMPRVLACKDADALDDQAMKATWGLHTGEVSELNCPAILDGTVQKDIDAFKRNVASTPMNTCARKAYNSWLSYTQYELDTDVIPECQRQERIANSTAKLPEVDP